ncbi:hypothetical protein [Methylobacterium oxalidis]|uniref:hypothetical protein n=1 Tax=Methylobacterium oxalidis TaxID=944322 RepID=UPI0033156F95
MSTSDSNPGVRDCADSPRTYDRHGETDLRLALSVAAASFLDRAWAAAVGTVQRIRTDAPDLAMRESGIEGVEGIGFGKGLVLAKVDGYESDYCCPAKGSPQVQPGERVSASGELGQVGQPGASELPHRHIAVRRAGSTLGSFAPIASAVRSDALTAQRQPLRRGHPRVARLSGGPVLNADFSDGRLCLVSVGLRRPAPSARMTTRSLPEFG